ncbi:hypothetical protein [Nocardia sp. CA-119907]|uniref:hypothetical protein n=1 Tax=Nocardia sp. CA-119907 TaxID=3239973 RepID=UPI003D994C04
MNLPLAQFLRHPDVVGLASRGPCAVASCFYDRRGRQPYCHVHYQRWNRLQRSGKAAQIDETHWRLTEQTTGSDGEVSLRWLSQRVVGELLYGLQQRVTKCSKTSSPNFQIVCDQARTEQVSTIEAISPTRFGEGQRKILLCFHASVRLVRSTPETERLKDQWDTTVFGYRGVLRFDAISQPWLREATKHAAFHDMSRRRGHAVKDACQARIKAMARLSESLRLQREDHGANPTVLAGTDIIALEHRLTFQVSEGIISDASRYSTVLFVRQWLRLVRALGLTRPSQQMHGLPEDFTIDEVDLPATGAGPDRHDKAGKDLPVEVIQHLCAHLDQFEELSNRKFRVAVELLIDTGRRPAEICGLNFDCLERDGQGKPILVFDNTKANRLGRRLPIPEPTAALIICQQQRVRQQFPDQPADTLKLLPTIVRNPHGRRSINESALSNRHRDWMMILPDITVALVVTVDGAPGTTLVPFDTSKTFPRPATDAQNDFLCRLSSGGCRTNVGIVRAISRRSSRWTAPRARRRPPSAARSAVDRGGARAYVDGATVLDRIRRAGLPCPMVRKSYRCDRIRRAGLFVDGGGSGDRRTVATRAPNHGRHLTGRAAAAESSPSRRPGVARRVVPAGEPRNRTDPRHRQQRRIRRLPDTSSAITPPNADRRAPALHVVGRNPAFRCPVVAADGHSPRRQNAILRPGGA